MIQNQIQITHNVINEQVKTQTSILKNDVYRKTTKLSLLSTSKCRCT